MYISSKYYYLLQHNVQKDVPKGARRSKAGTQLRSHGLAPQGPGLLWWEAQDSKALMLAWP